MWVSRNGKEQANKALKEARTQIATYESFLADYRQEHCNDTSREPLADSWYPPSSRRSLASSWYPASSASSGPAPDPTSQQTLSMPITSCCSRQPANCTCFAPSNRQSTNSRRSWATTSVSRRASISDRRHPRPSTYSRVARSSDSSQETGSSYSNYSMSTCPISTTDSMKAHLGGRLS